MSSTDRPSNVPTESEGAAVDSVRQGPGWLVVVGLIPPLTYALLAFLYAANFPYWDDDLEFLRQAPEGESRIAWLARGHNEHRLLVPRLVAETQCWIEGSMNFRHLAWAGGAFLFAMWACVVAAFRPLRAFRWHFAAVSALLFAPAAWPTITWTTSALQNNGILLLSFCALALFRSERPSRIAAALAVSALATFTSASGLLLFPVLAAWSAARVVRSRGTEPPTPGAARRGLVVLALVAVTAAATALVFFDGHPHPKHRIDLHAALSDPVQGALRVLGVLGSAAAFKSEGAPPLLHLSLVVGGAVLALVLIAGANGRFAGRPLLLAWTAFLLLSAASIAAGRIDEGLAQSVAPRYATLSIAALVVTYLAWMRDDPRLDGRWSGPAGLALGLTFWGTALALHAPKLAERHERVVAARTEWPETGAAFRSIARRDRAFPTIASAVHAGRFALPYLPPAQIAVPFRPDGDAWSIDRAGVSAMTFQGHPALFFAQGSEALDVTCIVPRDAVGASRIAVLAASDGAFEFGLELADRALGTRSMGPTSRVMRDLEFTLDAPIAAADAGRPLRVVRVSSERPVLVEAIRFLR